MLWQGRCSQKDSNRAGVSLEGKPEIKASWITAVPGLDSFKKKKGEHTEGHIQKCKISVQRLSQQTRVLYS